MARRYRLPRCLVTRGTRARLALPIVARAHLVQEFVHAGKAGQCLLDVVAVADADVFPDAEMRTRCDKHRMLDAEPFEEACRRNRQPVLHQHDRAREGTDEAEDVVVGVDPALELREIRAEDRSGTRENLLAAYRLGGDTREAV